ncbi:MAG: hypothetical protein M1833_006007 [Piccolia ochrophora]|nr:MAG: hypothetical protein M1833_006007 [Piccolia ochrophora]
MPFSHHRRTTSSSSQPHQDASQGLPDAASALFQASQLAGSIGAPNANLKGAATGSTAAGTDSFSVPLESGDSQPIMNTNPGGYTAPPSSAGLPGPGPSGASVGPGHESAGIYQSRPFEPPRRAGTFHRQPEELHIPSSPQSLAGHAPNQPHAPAQQSLQGQQEFNTVPTPNISLQQATPHSSGPSSHQPGAALPGALQPGNAGRPGPLSANTAPSTVPTVPQLQTQALPYTSPTRATTTNHSHSYSRSSPAGFEGQKYIPYSSSPDPSKYPATPSQKYTPIQMQHAPPSNSPLGLADIRPRADSGLDGPTSANAYYQEALSPTPSNSNYIAPWAIYAFDWCKWSVGGGSGNSGAGKVALGSYLEDGHNFIQILETRTTPQSSSDPSTPGTSSHGVDFIKMAEATHSYPVTRILWEPPSSQKQSTDLLATSGDHLRLWSLPANASSPNNSITRTTSNRDPAPYKLTPLALLSNSKSPEHTAPLTSLDWNTLSPSLIITSSIDTTCTIWDIPTLTAKTQLIAHDKEVFDVRFCANSVDVFVSCGADGSVRMFDLRSLEHSTIIYEPSEKGDKVASPTSMSPTAAQQNMSPAPPLLRLSASPHDAHLLATFSQDSNIIRILDVRQPGQALLELRGHASSINCIEWSPSRRGTLASGADDSLVLVWDLLNQTGAPPAGGINGTNAGQPGTGSDIGRGPSAAWRCDFEVGNISWAPQSALTNQGGDWLGVSGGRGIWGVKL